MNVRIGSIVHIAQRTYKPPNQHPHKKTARHIKTWCGLTVHIKGRPKGKLVTCVACLAKEGG